MTKRNRDTNLAQAVDNFLGSNALLIEGKKRKQKLELYCEGLKAKASQVEFALLELKKLENRNDLVETSTDSNEPPIQLRVGFFCDSFWVFLYSCLDVLAQIQNQAMKLDLDEKEVSFRTIGRELKIRQPTAPQLKALDECVRSVAFKNLANYRNCSVHRREIYMRTSTQTVQHSRGYSIDATNGDVSVRRVLCDNPLETSPRAVQNRTVPEYLEKTRDRVFSDIKRILRATAPIT